MDRDKNSRTCLVCGSLQRLQFRFSNGRNVFKCPGCGLRSLFPIPTDQELDKFYSDPDYFQGDLAILHNELQAGYDEKAPIIELYKKHVRIIKKLHPPPAKVLEIGCARGVLLDLFRKEGYEVAGFELNEYAADYAQAQFGIDVRCEKFEIAKIELASFDIVVSFDVIEHLPNPANFLKKVSSVLTDGGIVSIGTPTSRSLIYFISEMLALLGVGNFMMPLFRFYGRGVEHLNIFNKHNLSNLMKNSGLIPIEDYRYNIPLTNIIDITVLERVVLWVLMKNRYEMTLVQEKLTSLASNQDHQLAAFCTDNKPRTALKDGATSSKRRFINRLNRNDGAK